MSDDILKYKKAIEKSGYPLQLQVGALLDKYFSVEHEWAYLDRDTQELRNIDLFAYKLFRDKKMKDAEIYPQLDLIVECKKSELPIVFFTNGFKPRSTYFLSLSGLKNDSITIKTDDSRSTWSVPPAMVLGLAKELFVREPIYSSFFSRLVRKGKEFELSGSDFFNSVVNPISKAILYNKKVNATPLKTFVHFSLHLMVGLSVVDAPMLTAGLSENGTEIHEAKWVRMIRQDIDSGRNYESIPIDIVNISFLQEYLEKYLLPFSDKFSVNAFKHQRELASRKGFARGMEKLRFDDIEKRLKPL